MENCYKPCIFIDFDKTISPVHGFHAPPNQEVVDCINILKEKYSITIFSCRANIMICSKTDLNSMIDYLQKYNIHYDDVYYDKPLYFAVIDDRSYNPDHKSWADITTELMNKTT